MALISLNFAQLPYDLIPVPPAKFVFRKPTGIERLKGILMGKWTPMQICVSL